MSHIKSKGMKRSGGLGLPVSIAVIYLLACFLLLYFSHNITLTLLALAFSPVLLLWIILRIIKRNTSDTSSVYYEEYEDMVDWGIGEYKKTWKKIRGTKTV
jgi:hypothetical protein